MDYHKLKRRELQALCKKHGIPANLKNVEMADRLSSLLKEENPTKRGKSCLKNVIVLSDGDEEEEVESREPKRVKFSPHNETFVFEKTDPREMRLLARKRGHIQKPEIKEKPIIITDDDNVEDNVVRVLRRRSIVVKPDAGSGVGVVDGRGNLGRSLRSRGKKASVDEMVLSPCVEKKTKRGRKGPAVVEVVEEKCHEIEPEIKKGRKGRKTTKTIKEQEDKRREEVGDEELMEENDGDDLISERMQEVLSKVDASSSEQGLDDGKVHEIASHYVNQSVVVGCSIEMPATLRTDYVQDKETLPSISAPAHSLPESIEHKSDEQCHAAGDITYVEESDVKEKALTNVVAAAQTPTSNGSSVLQNSGDVEVESSVQTNKVEESSLNLSFVAGNNSAEETTSSPVTPPSNLKGQFSGGGQPICHDAKKSGIPGSSEASDAHWEQLSSPIGGLIGGMMESKTFESVEGQECYNQSRNEQFTEQENKCEESPYLSDSSENENAVEDECPPVIFKESDVQPTEQEKAAFDINFSDVEQTMLEICVDQQSSHFISEEKLVLGPETSFKAKVQSSIVVKGLTLSSNASAETLNKIMDEGKDTKVVTGVDSTSIDVEDCPLNQSLNNDDSEVTTKPSSTINTSLLYLQSQVDGDIRVLLGSTNKGEESCKETSKGDIAYLASNCKESYLAEEDKLVIVENLEEVNVKLETARDDMTNSIESKELKSETVARDTKQDAFAASNGNETPVSVQERKWSKVIYDGNICPSVSSIRNKASECILVSDKTKCIKLSSVEAAEDLSIDNSFFRSSSANLVNFEDRELSEVSHSENVLACSDLGSNEVSEHNPAVNTTSAVDKLGFHVKDDDKGADCPCKEILLRLENLCDNYFAQSSPKLGSSKLNTTMFSHTSQTCEKSEIHIFSDFSNKSIIDIEEFKSGEHMLVKDDQYDKGDKVETDAENSDALPVTPGKTLLQALVSEMHEGPESIARESLVGNVSTGEMNLQIIECVDRNNKAADLAEPGENVHSTWVGSLSFSVKGRGFDDIKEAFECTPEEQIDCQMNAGNSTGQEIGKEEKTDSYLHSVQEDTTMNENDNLASSGPEDSDSLPCDIDKVSDGDINIVHVKLIKCGAELEFNAGEGNCISGQQTITQHHEVDFMDPIQKDACMTEKHQITMEGSGDLESSPSGIYMTNSVPEYTVHKESRSPAYNDYTQELDPVKDPDAGDTQDKRGYSVKKDANILPFTPPLTNATSSESPIAMHKVLDSTSSQNFVDASGLHEMALDIPSDHLFTHHEMDDGYRMGNSKPKFEDAEDDTTFVGRTSSPPSICENNGVNASEDIVVGCAVQDFIHVEPMENGTPKACLSRDSSPYTAHEIINIRSEIDNCTAQTFKTADSVEVNGEGVSICGNESPKYSIRNELDEALGQALSQQTSSNVIEELKSAYNDYTEELDPARDPDARDVLEERDYSVEKNGYISPFTLPLTNATSSESLTAMHKVLDSISSQSFVDTSDLHEMALEVPSDHLFTRREMDDGYCIGNSESNSEDVEDDTHDTTHVGRASNPPSVICENKVANASEEIVVGCAVGDFTAVSNSNEEHGKVDAEQFSRDSENGVEWDGNDNDASDNKADADSSSPKMSENFPDQPQEQNHTPSMPSYQQMDPKEFETEDVKSKIESSVFTDSEIDLFWGEIEKDKVRELQIEASEVTLSVDEYEVASVENDTGSTHQPGIGDNSGWDEQTLQEVNDIDREERGESAEENDDEQKCINFKENENSLIRRENIRSILIHGTPQKLPPFIHDMKENAAAPKRLQMVGATAVKRRKALEDISK